MVGQRFSITMDINFFMFDIALIDDAIISDTFSGGGGTSSRQLATRLARRYKVLYLPKASVFFGMNEERKAMLNKNVEKIELMGMAVSQAFQELLKDSNELSIGEFINLRRKLIDTYGTEIKEAKIAYDNDFSPSMFPSPSFRGEILELAFSGRAKKIGLAFRGFSCINKLNRIEVCKTIIKNEPKSIISSEALPRYLSFMFHPEYDTYLIKHLLNLEWLAFVAIINESVIEENPQLSMLGRKLVVLSPGEASRFEVMGIKPRKQNYAIFFARLVPEKGLFEIPRILEEIKNFYGFELELHVIGKFRYGIDEHTFYRRLEKNNVRSHVKPLGFLDDHDLRNEIQGSKVFIYPSHSDSYALAICECLALKTQVVAYDIPSFRNLYSGIDAVTLVKEYDVHSMASAVVDILNQSEDVYFSKFESEFVKRFIGLHSNYDNVFTSLCEIIDKHLT